MKKTLNLMINLSHMIVNNFIHMSSLNETHMFVLYGISHL